MKSEQEIRDEIERLNLALYDLRNGIGSIAARIPTRIAALEWVLSPETPKQDKEMGR